MGSAVAMCCVKRGLFHPGELVDDVGSQVSSAPAGAIEGRQQPSGCGQEMKQIFTRPKRDTALPFAWGLEPE